MCRMIGIVGTHPLPLLDVMEAFSPLATTGRVKCTMTPGHLDGWGISGFSAQRAVYFDRRAEPLTEGKARFQTAVERAGKSQSPIVIGHMRKASAGSTSASNTHPFHYRDWIFAHNGTVFGADATFPLLDATPQGQTDSERFFLWMVEKIYSTHDRTEALAQLLKKSRDGIVFSALNFLMTDGEQLWAYRDVGNKRFDPGETLEERDKYYTLYCTRVERSAVVCSEPLPSISKNWQPFQQRTLAVFSPGMLAPRVVSL